MLAVAKAKAAENKIVNIHFIKGNTRRLDYEEDHFDLIITSNAPMYLLETVRILKPGGYFLASFSFGGCAISGAENDISLFLQKGGLRMKKMKCTGTGVYVLGHKPFLKK